MFSFLYFEILPNASTPQTCTLDVQRHQCMCGAEHMPYHSVAPSFCAQVVACRGRRPPNLHLQHGGGGVFEIASGRGALQAAGFAMVGVTVPSKVHHASMAYSDPTLAVHF